jgi:imidazoleglycerol phosphate dehydratase HisB
VVRADEKIVIDLAFGDVRSKRIETPNDFVSHMIEHIAWRLGCSIDLQWPGDDCRLLGRMLGARIGSFTPVRQAAAAQGMLDDGSAEARIALGEAGGLEIRAAETVDLEWFLSLRCEQLPSGRLLVDLLTGLAEGLPAKLTVAVCNHEDTHHTWEGVFRAVGVALNKIYAPSLQAGTFSTAVETDPGTGDIMVTSRSAYLAAIKRHTAETALSVTVDFEKLQPFLFRYDGAPILHYAETNALESFRELLHLFADGAGFSMQAVFASKMLSSSHVLLEDTGMVVGRALREILVKRMMDLGINGAGSSLERPEDFDEQKITVGVSVEGRKFWRFMPLHTTCDDIKRRLIIGQTIMNGLFTEDLDDFLDGLSWGLGCSIAIHIKDLPPADAAWRIIFENLGKALREVFDINPYQKGVSPGVKANLS